jgi:hypothetical protein
MALTFNGTNSGLTRSGSIVSTYPLTVFAWTRCTVRQTAFVASLAVEPGPRGGYEGHNMLADGTRMRALSTVGSSVSAYSTRTQTAGDWVPCMVVFSSQSLRKVYFGTGVVQTENTNVPQVLTAINTFCIGKQALREAAFWAGDLACVGLWNAELTQADYNTLSGGVVPSTVQSAALVDYWSLLTQGATQVGLNGRTLTAANTAQAATHPITEGGGGGGDTTAPVLTGSIAVSNLTSTGYTLTWPAGSDNAAVSGYDRSLDGGTSWVNVGNVLTINVSGRTAGATDQVQVRARDEAGNVSTPALSVVVALPAAQDTTLPVLIGSITVSNLASTSYTLAWPAGSDNVAVTAYEVSVDGGTGWTNVGNVLTANVSGRTAGATDAVRVRARDAAGNVSTPALSASVTLPGGTDTVAPTLTGAISVSALTSSSYSLSWPAASDNVGVVSYERSLDGGSNWLNVGNALGASVSGRASGTTDQVRVRARDAAGNTSTPPLATSVTLPGSGSGALATPPLKNNTGTVLAGVANITVNVYNASTGVLVVRKSGLTSDAAGIVAFNDAALVPGAVYAYEVVTPTLGRRLPTATAT